MSGAHLTKKDEELMNSPSFVSRSTKIIRWVARIWSIMLLSFAFLVMLTPDPYATEPISAQDLFLLSLYGVAILGLIIAWRWELVGSMIAIATLFIRELAWIILKGPWFVNFLIFWVLVLPPAILYLIAWSSGRRL
jgi:hypothetical protein